MIVEKQMECRLAGETEEVLGENLPQRHFCPSQNPTWPYPGLNPGRRGGKPATNHLSYGAATNRGNSAGTATRLHARQLTEPASIFYSDKRFFFLLHIIQPDCGARTASSSVGTGGWSGWSVQLMIRMSEAVHPLLHTSSWHGAYLRTGTTCIIQFNSLLFTCWVNSCKANYRHSTV
jgi:hypothetical protein